MPEELDFEEKKIIDDIVASAVTRFEKSDQLSADEKTLMLSNVEFVATLFKNRRDKKQIIRQLVLKGFSNNFAEQFVDSIDIGYERHMNTAEGRAVLMLKNKKKIFYGFIYLIVGIIVTFFFFDKTYEKKLRGFMLGLIIYGVLEIVRGLYGYLKYR